MRRTILLIGVAVVFCALPVNGALITIEIEAVVDSVWDDGNYLQGKVSLSDLITGTYTYDTDAPDLSSSSQVGRYEYFAYPCGFSLSVGGLEFRTDPADTHFVMFVVNNNAGIDGYSVTSYLNLPLPNGTSVNNIVWYLQDTSQNAISSTELTATAPVLDDWPSNFLDIGGGPGPREEGFVFLSHVTSAVIIPEPTTILLLGLGGLIFVRRIKK